MIQRVFKHKVSLVEQVDKFVDPSGDIAEFPNERVIHNYSFTTGKPLLEDAIAADGEIPDRPWNAADLAAPVLAQDQLALIPIAGSDRGYTPARRGFNAGNGVRQIPRLRRSLERLDRTNFRADRGRTIEYGLARGKRYMRECATA